MSSVSTSGSGAPKASFSFGRIWDQYGMLVVFAVLFIACAIFVPNFATFINMKGLGLAISMSGMVACGMLFCLASGDFDLSVASVIACAGVTTAVGLLGTDSATRSPKALLAKTKALNEEGLTAYCLTGAYDIPSPTVTGSLKDDVTYLSEVLGVKVALSDHRGGHPTLEQFIHMACQVRLAALTAGKPGVVHIHMGSGKRGLGLVYDLLEATDLPIWHFRPTHMSRWQSEAAAFARKGGMVDFTANADPEKCALPVLRTMEEAPLERITISSDAGGSMPRWSEDHCTMLGMGVGKMDNLLPTIRCLVREHRVPPERAIRLLTQNVADGLCLSRKGRLTVGADADVLLVDRDWNIHTVLAGGEIMVSDGQVVKQPYIS